MDLAQASNMSPPTTRFTPVFTNGLWLLCAALLWTGCTATYFLTCPGRIDILDGGIRFEVTRDLIESGRPTLTSPIYAPWALPGVDNRPYAFYEIGTPAISVPFVWFARQLSGGSREAEQFAFSLVTVPFAAASVSLLFLIYGRLGLPLLVALRWALICAFATMLWPYAGSTFDVAIQAFFLTLAVWGVVEARQSNSILWALTAGAAFAIVTNIQEFYFGLALCCVTSSAQSAGSLRRQLKRPVVLLVLLGAVVGLCGVLYFNAVRFGNPFDTGRTSSPEPHVGFLLIGLIGLIISPFKSVFLYSPTFALGLWGLRALNRTDDHAFAPIRWVLALQISIVASLAHWGGDWAWGPRYLVATLPIVAIGAPFARLNRRVTTLLCTAGVVVQLLAISVDTQRFFFEHGLSAFFWVDQTSMYRLSPLFSRPYELLKVVTSGAWRHAEVLSPSPDSLSMTASNFGPPRPSQGPQWLQNYLVFLVPRPWTIWSWYLPPHLRFGPTGLLTIGGGAAAFSSFLALFTLRRRFRGSELQKSR